LPIGRAHLEFEQTLSIRTVNEHSMIDSIARAATEFLRSGGAVE